MILGQNIFQEKKPLAVKGVHPFLNLFGIEWVVGFKTLRHFDFRFQISNFRLSIAD